MVWYWTVSVESESWGDWVSEGLCSAAKGRANPFLLCYLSSELEFDRGVREGLQP